MKIKSKILIVFILFISALFIFYYFHKIDTLPDLSEEVSLSGLLQNNDLNPVKIGGKTIFVHIADTPEKRNRGLSGANSLKENEGMLFVFESPLTPGFWMKDMLIPIDIIWISADKKIVSVEKSVKPETYPKAFYPERPVRYVLEVSAGFFEKNNLHIDDTVYW